MILSCPECDRPIEGAIRFCPSCGTSLGAANAASRPLRKVVTVLFADISGSTQLGEQLDPEAVRTLLARHFAAARSTLEAHGGTVEKFIGDAVMAVFGVPRAHEDDALRAVRAAVALQHRIAEINADPSAAARVDVRIGVNTGEVVTGSGSGETLVTGDAVNTAARLEQAAQPGEILVGGRTLELVRDAVEIKAVPRIAAKGKAEPIEAVRIVRMVGSEGRRRRLDVPIVGRQAELEALHSAFDDALKTAMPRLVTVVAAAGIGKSRLVLEFGSSLAPEATVVKGRCLPYGEGITYWPIREILHQLAGVEEHHASDEVRRQLASLSPNEEGLDALASLVGLEAPPQRQDELFWAARSVFERLTDTRPLVALVEDLHWAEETLLDLLQYVIAAGRGAVLLVATARPELLETRPGWGSGAAGLMALEPLKAEVAEELFLRQPGAAELSPDVRTQVLTAADGNALYLEEMAAMLREGGSPSGDPTPAIPPTIQALLAARLDSLQSGERTVLEHGSVIGQSFEAPAVAAIGSDSFGTNLTSSLMALVRRELLRPERAELTGADAYQFRHILIRDAAYASLSKTDRTRLHEAFASWLEAAAGERIAEYEEIVAHHLDQALTYRRELGQGDDEIRRGRVARWALRAGLHAARRDDASAAIVHLNRAAQLGRGIYDIESVALQELSDLHQDRGSFAEAESVIDRALEIALAEGNQRDWAIAYVNQLFAHRHTQPATWVRAADRVRTEAIPVLEAAGDEAGLAAAWHLVALAAEPDLAASNAADQRALVHARSSADPRWLGWMLGAEATRVVSGPTPVPKAIEEVSGIASEVAGLARIHQAGVSVNLALLEAMAGRTADAVARVTAARELHHQLGHRMEHALSAVHVTMVHEYAGHPERAEAALREAIAAMEEVGDYDLGPYLCAHLARILARQGRSDEALAFIEQAQTEDSDPIRDLLCHNARSFILAGSGDHEASVTEAQAAVDGVPHAYPNRLTLMLIDLAKTLEAAGRAPEARSALARARSAAAAKGNVALLKIIGDT